MSFEALGKSGISKASRLLESFPCPPNATEIKMVSDEVTALCPVTGQPDQYVVSITYGPDKLCIESKSLKLKLQSFRSSGAFVETLADTIATHVVASIDPIFVNVEITQKSRGGVSIVAKAAITKIPDTSGVYIIVNTSSGLMYVGSSVALRSRWNSHRSDLNRGSHANLHLQRAWNKYGQPAFVFHVLELAEVHELHSREEFWINELDSGNPDKGYNLCVIPTQGTRGLRWKHTAETCVKISAAQLGKKKGPLSEATRLKISLSQRGKKRSAESAAKSAASRTGLKRGKYSAEHRAKISAGHLGKKKEPQSPEHKRKRVESAAATRLAKKLNTY